MFSPQYGAAIYKSTMNGFRFNFMLRCLRFDDLYARAERNETDKFAPFRHVFDSFVANCQKHYIPGDKLTIDEQLLAFRGNCPFRMYMPNKPAKYGNKLIMVCDAESYYMCNASTYLGKDKNKRRSVKVAHTTTMKLAEPFLDAGRNITMDNWFTSLLLAKDLYARNTTVVGTIRKKSYIPSVMLGIDKNRPVNTSSFLFDENTSLVSYKVKKDKTVILLSILHNQPTIGDKNKPEIVHYYNKIKGGVDVLDHVCHILHKPQDTKEVSMLCVLRPAEHCRHQCIHTIQGVRSSKNKQKTTCSGFLCTRWHTN